jgi:pilus assembly protein FimV
VTRALPASADISLEPVLDFEPPSLLDAGSTEPAAMLATPPTAENDGIDFDLEDGDPLARKLELAEEFRQIGDVEGARDLLEEVIAKADGMLKSKAQVMLDGLA